MAQGVVATEFQLLLGDTIEVKGRILRDAKSFAVNLGQDRDNLVLHFNPCFLSQTEAGAISNTIVCNSLEDGVWGEEERLTDSPFKQGDKVQLSFTFLYSEIKVLAEGHEFSFPNRLGLKTIEYIAVEGDFKVRVLRFL
ncbi:16 kDa beta-galactoside-binding lectin-like isoform X2 [Rhineura floridana]|uniref:16 kDa beta-galactoside-binding lectin-like isoform X2 n=1 Tax=Rhineura floridana TaxID=261503 RepID=UPI002AC85172|nr:16 kDa beta-galactoside-binding lectin-like isoform X2 [Rhineura floridana]